MTKAYEYNKRWREKYPAKRARGRSRYKSQFVDGAFRSDGEWTDFEIKAILERKQSDRALASRFGRSVRAIQNKRHMLKQPKE